MYVYIIICVHVTKKCLFCILSAVPFCFASYRLDLCLSISLAQSPVTLQDYYGTHVPQIDRCVVTPTIVHVDLEFDSVYHGSGSRQSHIKFNFNAGC